MKHAYASAIGVAASAMVAASAITFTAEEARADDITIDRTPFASSASRVDVRSAVTRHPELTLQAAQEWSLQENDAPRVTSAYTRAEARTAYVKERRDLRALYAEDSGSNSPWLLKGRMPDTAVMGAPAP